MQITAWEKKQKQIHNNQDLMGDQMDTHFAAMEEGGGVCLKVREDCMEAAPVFEDQTACRKIPPQPPTPFPLQPFWASTLYNITGSLCSSFLNQESPPHRGRAETCSIWLRQHNDQLSVLTVCQDDHWQSDRSAFDKNLFRGEPMQEMLFACGHRTRVVALHHPFVHPGRNWPL